MEWQEIHTGAHNKYSANLNKDEEPAHREKRQQNINNLGQKNTCIMELRSDPVFWDRYIDLSAGVSSKANLKNVYLLFINPNFSGGKLFQKENISSKIVIKVDK